MAIVLAGPFANLLLAIVLYWGLFMTGVVGIKPVIDKIIEGSPAAAAQMRAGEVLQKLNGKEVGTWQDVRWLLLKESLKNNQVKIQTINEQQTVNQYLLDVSELDHDDVNQDILEKIGLTMYKPEIPALVGEVVKASPADQAGLRTGDLILSVNNSEVADWESFVSKIRMHPDVKLDVMIQRGVDSFTLSIQPEAIMENGQSIGRIGAGFQMNESEMDRLFVTTHYSAITAIPKAIEKTWDTALFSLEMLKNMVMGQISWKGISGPVTIASYAGQSASMGIKVFIGFLALISISIGVLNLLPIPILDGGHFMYYMVEFFTGKPVPDIVVNIGQRIGFFLLGCMMILALYNDMNRLITG
jgi:regulator of sigma E protease